MPIPYLGSKCRSAGKIYSTIRNLNPDSDTLVDLFCGGFAISEYFLKKGWKVIANDKNKYVIALLKKIVFEGLPEDITTQFVTRDKFFNVLKHADSYEEWYIGYIMCIWSFGSNQTCYLYGKDLEKYKEVGHSLVINRDPSPLLSLFPNIPKKYIEGILKQETWYKRRIALTKVATACGLQILQKLQRLERLERLERLQNLERLERQEEHRVFLSCCDYREVNIPKGAVIYCDPPYRGKAEYSEGGFNTNEFWSWVKEKSKTNRIYISEYTAPPNFLKVLEFQQNSGLQGGSNTNTPNECLFTII